MQKRCEWAEGKPDYYLEYHDREWGVPVHDDQRLFEFLILEGAQAGLSWETVLQKRNGYREVFMDFDIHAVAGLSDQYLEGLRQESKIIRNRLKIESARINARAAIHLQKDFGSLDTYFWSFVDGQPIQNHFTSLSEVPASTPLSDRISKDLKKRGFKFVGSTIIYAFMQATGIVNDHTTDCSRYQELL
jgi:DNA-3-methyladenine glycosylase I